MNPRSFDRTRRFVQALVFSIAWPALCHAGPVEQATLTHLANLRAVHVTAEAQDIARYNQQMDESWKYFLANKDGALPVLREQLAAEMRQARPNDWILLDIGYFLQMHGAPQDNELSKSALLSLDPKAPLVRQNDKELFEFTHLVAASHDERVLRFIDKAFLREKTRIIVPQHALTLDETLTCVFLYGVYGDGAERHLQPLLADATVSRRVIEILMWLGSPESVPAVEKAYAASPDKETFLRATAYMMKAGGPPGRAAMLRIRANDLDAGSREYYAKVRPAIESTDFDGLRKQFGAAGTGRLSNEQVRARLAAMNANDGKDDSTEPTDIIDATLPRELLIGDLVAIRAKAFRRLSDEALSDVEMTNALINALRYRKS